MSAKSPVESAMKQTAKTDAERGEGTAPNTDPPAKTEAAVREGDKPVGESKTGGSSPYEEPHHPAKSRRSK